MELVNQQDELEQSNLSINRLEELLHTIENEKIINQTRNRRQELERNLDGRYRTANDSATSLVVVSKHAATARKVVASIENAVRKLATVQDYMESRSQAGNVGTERLHHDSQKWSLGSVIYQLEKRSVLRGEIELRRSQPIAPNMPDWVVQYLMSIPGARDQITREIHGHWGYHYHYLDNNERRSDTLLTFNQIVSSTGDPVLCWEKHAQGQKFKARAYSWRDEKRKSIYYVCHPDTLRFALAQFKRPAADAEVVWP